jgi:hypothetical protein
LGVLSKALRDIARLCRFMTYAPVPLLAKRRPLRLCPILYPIFSCRYPISKVLWDFGYWTATLFLGAAHGEEHPLARRQGKLQA